MEILQQVITLSLTLRSARDLNKTTLFALRRLLMCGGSRNGEKVCKLVEFTIGNTAVDVCSTTPVAN